MPPRTQREAVRVVLAKHRRAEVHLKALQEGVQSFLRDKPYRLGRPEPDADGTEYVFRVFDVEPVPESIELLIGDVVHNARVTLDHLAYRLVRAPNRQTAFPIMERPRHDARGKRIPPIIPGGVPMRVRKVLNRVQPYFPNNPRPRTHPLFVLKELDDADKHRLLLATTAAVDSVFHGEPHTKHQGTHAWDFHWGPLEHGKPVATLYLSAPEPEMDVDFGISPVVALLPGTGGLTDADNVINILWYLLKAVRETVDAFAAFL